MRTERQFDLRKTFYALLNFKWSGRYYQRGEHFPSRDITRAKLKIMFQNGRIGYAEDFKTNKVGRKPVELEEVEQPVRENVQAAPAPQAAEQAKEAVEEKGKPEDAGKPEADSEVAEVVQDDDKAFMVNYKGKTFEINRNQIRGDGTLTAGGKKAYDKAE